MKFQNAFDVWASPVRVATAQPGQWVFAGDRANKGVFLGVTSNGSLVVAWYGNAKSRASYRDYVRSLRDYALS